MNENEHRIADVQGRFAFPVERGSPNEDANWRDGRLLLSNKRIVLAGDSDQRELRLSEITDIGGRFDVNQAIASVARYLSIHDGHQVYLLAPEQFDSFQRDLFESLLTSTLLDIRHPAVKGGVVQETDWEKARLKVADDSVDIATSQGQFISVDLDDVGSVDVSKRSVQGNDQIVVEVEHTVEGASVRTYFSGPTRYSKFLEVLFEEAKGRNDGEIELDSHDKEVLMALYAGVSPFDIPDFTGIEVDALETIFKQLVELNVLNEVRKRREVELTTRGRNLASEVISEE